MPGYANYKRLFREEFKTLKWEGYDPDKYIVNDKDSPDFCPDPNTVDSYPDGDDFWRLPYENLVKVMDTPIREGYPYYEPNGFDEIMAEAVPAPEMTPLSEEEYKKRLYGAFFGRCAAVILGKPLEMGLTKKFIRDLTPAPLQKCSMAEKALASMAALVAATVQPFVITMQSALLTALQKLIPENAQVAVFA